VSLVKYIGPANSVEIFQHLVGEKITACFMEDGQIWLVLESGCALVVGPGGGPENGSFLVYWKERKDETSKVVSERLAHIRRQMAELQSAAGMCMEHADCRENEALGRACLKTRRAEEVPAEESDGLFPSGGD
jgi:hypothetical protein